MIHDTQSPQISQEDGCHIGMHAPSPRQGGKRSRKLIGTNHPNLLILQEFSNSVIVCFDFHHLVHATSYVCYYHLFVIFFILTSKNIVVFPHAF